jgi:hypothetical protein
MEVADDVVRTRERAGDRFADMGDCHYVVSLIGAQRAINGILRRCFGPL